MRVTLGCAIGGHIRRLEPTACRRLLQLPAVGSGALWLPRSAWSQSRLTDNPFTLGVASGSPAAESVVLWTRLHSTGLFGRFSLPDAPYHRALGSCAP